QWVKKHAVPNPDAFDHAQRTADELSETLFRISAFAEFAPDYPLAPLASRDECTLAVDALEARLRALASGASQLRDWALYQTQRASLSSAQEAAFLQAMEAQKLPIAQLVDAF